MPKIKFSVVIPTRDRRRLLKEAVQSAISQSLPPDEIIIVGELKDIDDEVFKLYKKVRYARALPNIGVSQARNIGICQAGGDYIAFLDDDDTWDKEYLKEVSDAINKTGATIVLGGVKILETGEIWQFRSDPINSLEYFKKNLLLTNPGAMGSNTVVERKLILASSGFDPFLPTGEDRGIIFDLLSKPGAKVVRAEKAFMYYRTATKSPRLTDMDSLLKGKTRFLLKYWKEMNFSIRLEYFWNYQKLKDEKLVHIEIVLRKIIRKVKRIRRKIYKIKKHPFYSFFTFPYRMATAKRRALPDFLIIGTQNGGTTSLRYLLGQHPQVYAPKGEPRYFNIESNYKKGELWYRSHFPLRSALAHGDVVGEKTPGYLFNSNAAKRIQKDLPNAKLICLLRNPTERAISDYFMALGEKRERRPIMEVVLGEGGTWRSYKKRGLYLEQLQRYEKYLKKNQLLILSSEEFLSNPQKVLKQVFRFLGVDETFRCSNLSPRHVGKNKTSVPREVYEYLNAYFKPHNRRLYNYLNRDFGW